MAAKRPRDREKPIREYCPAAFKVFPGLTSLQLVMQSLLADAKLEQPLFCEHYNAEYKQAGLA